MAFTMLDYGVQDHGFQYRQEARARLFNRLLYGLIPPGIYEGLELEKIPDTNTQIRVTPGICFIRDNSLTDETVAVRVRTTEAQGLEAGNVAKPYVVLRFTWDDSEENYMTMGMVGFSDDVNETNDELILPTDLVVGKVLYDGSNNVQDFFDYSRRNRTVLPFDQIRFKENLVQKSEDFPKRVYITARRIRTSKGDLSLAGGNFPNGVDIPDTGAQGRNDLIWLDEEGDVQVTQGTPATVPITPRYGNKFVIAEIRRGPNRDSIDGNEIYQIRDTDRQGMVAAKDFAIDDVDNYYTEDNIEAAFKEIYELWDGIRIDTENNASNFQTHEALEADTNTVHGINVVTTIT